LERQSTRKILRNIGVSFLIVIGILVIFTTFFLKNIVNNQLKKEIENTFGGFYTLNFEKSATSLSFTGFNVQFEGVTFSSDTSNLGMLARYPALFFKSDKLRVLEINIFEVFWGPEINTGKVQIDKPELLFYVPESGMPPGTEESGSSESAIERINMKEISLIEGKASFVFHRNQNDTLFAGSNLSLHIENLGFNLLSEESVLNTATLDQMEFSLNQLRMSPEDSEYDYEIDSLSFNYKAELLACYDLSMKPKANAIQMARNTPFRRTVFDMEIDSLIYQSKDFKALKRGESIKGQSLKLMGLRLHLDRNKSIALDESRYKKLFHESLLALPFHVELDTIQINNALIDYKIHQRRQEPTGNLILSGLNGIITPIDTRNRQEIKAKFTGRFMREASFAFNMNLPLKSPKKHSYNGNIGSMSFRGLNPLISNLTRVRMDAGTIQSIEFQGNAGELLNEGSMKLIYSDLKLSVTDNSNNKKWLQSGLGNLLVRNNSKADKAGNPVIIQYSYQRPHYKDHLDLYAGGLIDGFAQGVLPKVIYQMVMGN